MTDKHQIISTQKPVALYKWLLSNYAKPGDKILDTHVGSASRMTIFKIAEKRIADAQNKPEQISLIANK